MLRSSAKRVNGGVSSCSEFNGVKRRCFSVSGVLVAAAAAIVVVVVVVGGGVVVVVGGGGVVVVVLLFCCVVVLLCCCCCCCHCCCCCCCVLLFVAAVDVAFPSIKVYCCCDFPLPLEKTSNWLDNFAYTV